MMASDNSRENLDFERRHVSKMLKYEFLNEEMLTSVQTAFNLTSPTGKSETELKQALFKTIRETQELPSNKTPEDLLFCFDESGRFVCTHNLLNSLEHSVTLPEPIETRTNGLQLTLFDKVKLLAQFGIQDSCGIVEMPWSYLCDLQMIDVAINHFGIKINPTQLHKPFDISAYLSALIRSSNDFAASYGKGHNFPVVLYSFSLDDILSCIGHGKGEDQFLKLGKLQKLQDCSNSKKRTTYSGDSRNNNQVEEVTESLTKRTESKAKPSETARSEVTEVEEATRYCAVDNELSINLDRNAVVGKETNGEETRSKADADNSGCDQVGTTNSMDLEDSRNIPDAAGNKVSVDGTKQHENSEGSITEVRLVCTLNECSITQLKSLLMSLDDTEEIPVTIISKEELQEVISRHRGNQHHLLRSPSDEPLYCFDSQSAYVCLFQELNTSDHVISLPKALVNLYNLEPNSSHNFSDRKRILLQESLVKATEYSSSKQVTIPWTALTLNQMKAAAKTFCPGLTDSKLENKSESMMNYLTKKITKSKTFMAKCSERKLLMTSSLFTFNISSPLELEWDFKNDVETHEYISHTKRILKTQSILHIPVESRKQVGTLSLRDCCSPIKHQSMSTDHTESTDKPGNVLDVGTDCSPDVLIKRPCDSPSHEDLVDTQSVQTISSSFEQTLNENISDITSEESAEENLEEHTQEVSTINSLVRSSDIEKTPDIRIHQKYPGAKQSKASMPNFTSTPNNSNKPKSLSSEEEGEEDICKICQGNMENEKLTCHFCKVEVHYKCYNQQVRNKPVAPSYYTLACTKLTNHRWFCNDCLKIQLKPIQPQSLHCISKDSSTQTEAYQNNHKDRLRSGDTKEHFLDTLNDQVDILYSHQRTIENMERILKDVQSHTKTIDVHQEALRKIFLEIKTVCHENDFKLDEISGHIKGPLQTSIEETAKSLEAVEKKSCNNMTFSNVLAANRTRMPEIRRYQAADSTVKPECTVIILNVSDRNLVSNSSKIKQTFNQHFTDVKINNAFISKGGTVFLEFKDPETANKVKNNWEGHFFTRVSSEGSSRLCKTTCKILSEKNKSVILKHVPTDIRDEELTKEIATQYPSAVATRFITRDKRILQTVKVDFQDVNHQSKSIAEGIKIYKVVYKEVEIYRHRQRVIQCFKCYRFGHIARLCKDENQTCRDCGGGHHYDNCSRIEKKCVNCKGNHIATNTVCKMYQEIVQTMKDKSQTRPAENTSNNLLSRSDFTHIY